MVGASSVSAPAARFSAAAEAMMASAAAWSAFEGALLPTVFQAEVFFLRNSALLPATGE